MSQTVSSTQYRFSYQVRSPEDIPDDFLILDKDLDFESAIFLPQGHSSWPYRGTPHPPRMLFLKRDCLKVYTHPTADQAPVVLDLDQLQIVEVGRFLLLSWMRFFTQTMSPALLFSSVDDRVVNLLLEKLRRIWLPSVNSVGVCLDRFQADGDRMTFKFQQRLQRELDAGEAAQETLFLAHRNIGPKRYMFRDVAYVHGDLLAVTSKRILWITDRDPSGGGREIYGSIARYAPIRYLQKVCLSDRSLFVGFQTGRSWSISLGSARP
jgi:hypothetical protein